jgi:hypothetical protein
MHQHTLRRREQLWGGGDYFVCLGFKHFVQHCLEDAEAAEDRLRRVAPLGPGEAFRVDGLRGWDLDVAQNGGNTGLGARQPYELLQALQLFAQEEGE